MGGHWVYIVNAGGNASANHSTIVNIPSLKCGQVGGQVPLQGWPHPCGEWVGQGDITFKLGSLTKPWKTKS